MTDNNILRLPSAHGPGNVDMPLICEAVGLPLDYLTLDNLRDRLIPSIVTTFCDGEVTGVHNPDTDPVLIEHFGTIDYAEGVFGSRIRELADGEDPTLRLHTDRLIRRAARILAIDVVNQRVPLPLPMVKIDTVEGTLTFDEQTVSLDKPPETVIDYGPGLQGRHHITNQVIDSNEGRSPYRYFALTKGPFINAFLMEYWIGRANRQYFKDEVLGQLYMGREDGIASATEEMIKVQTKFTGAAALADVIIASAVQTAGSTELEKGIGNAYRLLKSKGVLLVRAPKVPDGEECDAVPASAMVEMAAAAGFDTDKAQYFDVMTGPGDTPTVEALSVAFRK